MAFFLIEVPATSYSLGRILALYKEVGQVCRRLEKGLAQVLATTGAWGQKFLPGVFEQRNYDTVVNAIKGRRLLQCLWVKKA